MRPHLGFLQQLQHHLAVHQEEPKGAVSCVLWGKEVHYYIAIPSSNHFHHLWLESQRHQRVVSANSSTVPHTRNMDGPDPQEVWECPLSRCVTRRHWTNLVPPWWFMWCTAALSSIWTRAFCPFSTVRKHHSALNTAWSSRMLMFSRAHWVSHWPLTALCSLLCSLLLYCPRFPSLMTKGYHPWEEYCFQVYSLLPGSKGQETLAGHLHQPVPPVVQAETVCPYWRGCKESSTKEMTKGAEVSVSIRHRK